MLLPRAVAYSCLLAALSPAAGIAPREPAWFEPAADPSAGFATGFARSARWSAGPTGAWITLAREGSQQSIRMRFEGANAAAPCRFEGRVAGVSHYMLGADSRSWRRSVPRHEQVVCAGIYPGIDIAYHGADGEIEYDLRIAPGADPSRAAVAFEGVDAIEPGPGGELILRSRAGLVRQQAPIAYQQDAGGRRAVSAAYRIERGRVRFETGGYDKSKPLVIDPIVTSFDSSFAATIVAIDTDRFGNLYLAGSIAGGADPRLTPQAAGRDAWLSKRDRTGRVIYSLATGGSGTDTTAAMVIGPSDDIYLAINTDSKNIPRNRDTTRPVGAGFEAVLMRLPPDALSIQYSMYIGGRGEDVAYDMTVDGRGFAYVVGETSSIDFPQVNPLNTGFAGLVAAFIVSVDNDGNYQYSTLFGGFTSRHVNLKVRAARDDSVYVSGLNDGIDFPVVGGLTTQPTRKPHPFLTRFDFDRASFLRPRISGYMPDGGKGLAIDPVTGEVLLLGDKLTRWNADGNTPIWQDLITGAALDVDEEGNAYVVGQTNTVPPGLINAVSACNNAVRGGTDGTVVKVNPAGEVLMSTCLTGPLPVTTAGVVFPLTATSLLVAGQSQAPGGAASAYLASLDLTCATTGASNNEVRIGGAGGGFQTTVYAPNECDWLPVPNSDWILPLGPAGARYRGTTQIGYTIPPNGPTPRLGWVATGGALIRVSQDAGTIAITAPGIGEIVRSGTVTIRWTGSPVSTTVEVFNRANGQLVFSGAVQGAETAGVPLPSGIYRVVVAGVPRDFDVALDAPAAAPSIVSPSQGAQLAGSTQTLAWTRVTGAQRYEVEVIDATAGAVAELLISTTDPDTSTIYSFGGSTRYDLRVRACSAACGPWSAARNFGVNPGTIPGVKPAISSAAVQNGNAARIVWGAVTGADLYRVLIVQPSSGPGGGALTVASARTSGTEALLPVPSGAASALVAACTGRGCGPFSDPAAINPGGPNPAAPMIGQPAAGSTVDGPAVLFSWTRVPGDNGSNTTYRLYVQDLSRQSAALDVFTTQNFWAAAFRAEGARYDAVVIANPGTNAASQGAAAGFNVRGSSAPSPTLAQPAFNGSIARGSVQLAWTPVPGATLYEYFIARGADTAARGVTTGLNAIVPLTTAGAHSAIVRACPASKQCTPGSGDNWGPWSNLGGAGVTNFTVTQ